jgi:tetratricopeptide (TPR) repeat protein
VHIEPVKKRANRQRTLELIDKFIENESDLAIKPLFPEGKTVDISKSSVADDSEIVSETLAQIYLKQGNKQKALRTYQKLMLKFPEKSSYFESLLRNL